MTTKAKRRVDWRAIGRMHAQAGGAFYLSQNASRLEQTTYAEGYIDAQGFEAGKAAEWLREATRDMQLPPERKLPYLADGSLPFATERH